MITLFGWIVRLGLGAFFASMLPQSSVMAEWFPVAVLINALGIHLLSLSQSERQISPRVLVPYAWLFAIVVIGTSTVAYALPINGCQGCLDQGNGFWWCVAIWGIYCW